MLRRWRGRLERLLTWRRVRAWALVLVALYLVAWVDVIVTGDPPLNSGGVPIAGDYIAFHAAARLVLGGQASRMYDHDTVVAVQDELLGGHLRPFYDAFRNPPFVALLYTPLAWLDLLPAFVAWCAIGLGCLGLAVRLLLERQPTLRPRWRGLLVIVFAFAPVYFGLIDGENALLSLLLYALIYRAFVGGHERALGVWSALGLFKPQLFVVFPIVLVVTRRWRALAFYAITAAVLAGISFALAGVEGMRAWVRILVEPETGNAAVNGWRMASAKSFFDALLPGSAALAWGLFGLAALGAVGVLAWTWTRPRLDVPAAWLLTTLIAVLIDPHLVDYDMTVLVAGGIVGAALAPRLAWAVLPLYLVTLLRAQVPIGDSTLQLTAPLLAGIAIWVARHLEQPVVDAESRPPAAALAGAH